MDDAKIKSSEMVKDIDVKEVSSGETSSKTMDEGTKLKINNLKKPSEQDLDAFLLGDLEDGDELMMVQVYINVSMWIPDKIGFSCFCFLYFFFRWILECSLSFALHFPPFSFVPSLSNCTLV